MQLLLIGYGKMNRLVEELAHEQGHQIAKVIRRPQDWSEGWTPGLVGIDFSQPEAVMENLERAMLAGIPMVIGTTGWYDQLDRAQALVEDAHVGAVYGANFSVGVQAFYRIAAAAARLLPAGFPQPGCYASFIQESHHAQKKDAPSGTALRLGELLGASGHPPTSIASTRAGAIPGTHTVGFDGTDDSITLVHTARSRRGFAAGALLAAAWILGRRGLHEYSAVFDSLTSSSSSPRP